MIGETIGQYRVLECLGSGGMGVVFSAEDTVLGRRVALKFPSGEKKVDPQTAERFLREARSASSLNHPSICTIYQVGEHEGRPYLAMELVDGVTLRERIEGRPLPVPLVLDLALQIADALDVAHAAGIVHRDIKPSNIMVTRRGQVKVMDFGLAKLLQRRAPLTVVESAAPTVTAPPTLTTEGAAIGTVVYMSPEQARGEVVDERSDLFSFGLVLYEMVTGRTAFGGGTNAVVFDAILNRAPVAASHVNPTVPPELERIIDKALEKDRDERYQTAADMRADLKRLKRHIESGRRVGSSFAGGAPPSSGDLALPPDASPDRPQPLLAVVQGSGGRPVDLQVVDGGPGRSAASLTATPPAAVEPRAPSRSARIASLRGRRTWVVAAAVLVPALVIAGWFVWTSVRSTPPRTLPFQSPVLRPLTFSGKVGLAAISADGRYVVHTEQDGQSSSLWMRQVATASHVQILPAAQGRFDGLTLSPDANYVYYVWYQEGENLGVVFRLPTLGGTPQRVIEDVDTPLAFSPDGSRVAFVRGGQGGSTHLMLAAVSGTTDARVLAARERPREYLINDIGWSPDGRFIAIAGQNRRDTRVELLAIDVATGEEQPLSNEAWFGFSGLVWRPDNRGLIVTGTLQAVATTGHQIFEVPWPPGPARRISSDIANYSWPRLTADGRTLSLVRDERQARLSAVRLRDGGPATATGVNGDGAAGLDLAADGAIVYTSIAAGRPELWLAAPGQPPRAVTADDASEWAPRFTPEGQRIVYYALRGGKSVLCRIDREGTRFAVLAETNPAWSPVVTPDGRWVLFTDTSEGIKRVSIDGGSASPLVLPVFASLAPPVTLIALSRDGTRMAVSHQDRQRRGHRVAVVASDGTGEPQLVDLVARPLQFSADVQSIYYAETRDGVGNLFELPIAGGTPKQVTQFPSDSIMRFAVSPDETTAAFSRGTIRNDVVLLQEQGGTAPAR
jgi:serine/threonine protein kinase/Tol biopolymer transport system component